MITSAEANVLRIEKEKLDDTAIMRVTSNLKNSYQNNPYKTDEMYNRFGFK